MLAAAALLGVVRAAPAEPPVKLGAYFFDGWSGRNKADGDPAQPWAKGAPTHLTKALAEQYADREPLWGWRADQPEIMRRQIDLAADHGLAFWAFCWYFRPTPQAVAEDPKHTGLRLFLAAPNRERLQFCLLIANHDSYQLTTLARWREAAEDWLPYLRHPLAVTVGGKPLIILFNPKDALPEGMAAVEAAARAAGLPGVTFAGCGVNLPPPFAVSTRYNAAGGYMKGWKEFAFTQVMENHRVTWKGTAEQRHIPVGIVGWDRRPWETAERGSFYYTGRTPALFGQHVRDLLAWMNTHPNEITAERLALLYAWNEIGEGGYLMPTRGDPEGAYLRELKAALAEAGPPR
ncbi:MAG: glycoside hydrolase family 99-like domain-containing protein [Verrucomicrobia bacterium]|nr:glycoside hydrolase family 99-like domain-containing protein [Verrucomicrobiota bacterium]